MRPMEISELHGEDAHRARGTVDQHSFAGSYLCSLEETLPGSQRPDGHGSRGLVGEGGRLAGYARRRCEAELGSCPVRKPVVQAVNLLPHLEAVRIFPQFCDDARKLMPRHST